MSKQQFRSLDTLFHLPAIEEIEEDDFDTKPGPTIILPAVIQIKASAVPDARMMAEYHGYTLQEYVDFLIMRDAHEYKATMKVAALESEAAR